jgi:hypothetical protein
MKTKLFILLVAFSLSVAASWGQTFRKEMGVREMENETPLIVVNDVTPSPSGFEKIRQKLASIKQEIPRLTHQFLARLSFKSQPKQSPSEIVNNSTAGLSLEEMIKDKGLIKSAWVKFDEDKQVWTAKWSKPRLLNYGILLKPALEKSFAAGDWLEFESEGVKSVITKKNDALFLTQNGTTSPLNSKDLNRLLASAICKDGISLSVDSSGNLILQASGAKATQMAKLKS